MESRAIKIYKGGGSADTALRIIPGHFATSHSHINLYIDMTYLKIRQKEAVKVARDLASDYVNTTMIDTIVCMDGCEMIGGFLAEELTRSGIMSINSHNTLYVVKPEFNTDNQLIFRDNIQPAIVGKHVLLLIASATTGKTIRKSLECITYYGGIIAGVSAIFSAVDEVDGIPVKFMFSSEDLPDYQAYDPHSCPLCKANRKLEALVNSYGYSKL